MSEFKNFFEDLEEEGIALKNFYPLFERFENFLKFTKETKSNFLVAAKKFNVSLTGLEALEEMAWQRMRLIFNLESRSILLILFECFYFDIRIKKFKLDKDDVKITRKIFILILDEILGVQKRVV